MTGLSALALLMASLRARLIEGLPVSKPGTAPYAVVDLQMLVS